MSSRERIQKALDSLLYLPHLQAQHSDEQLLPSASSNAADPSGGKGRPWDRGDLFRRLATFRAGTWFCKPAAISPVECARRGWTNTALDLLSCEFCKAKLSCPIPPDLSPEEAAQAAQRCAARLADAHDAACPWRTAASALSLLHFPPLTTEAVRRDFDGRYAALQRLACLPPVAMDAYRTLAAASSTDRLNQLLLTGPQGSVLASDMGAADADMAALLTDGVAALGTPQFQARARLLALCGWDVKLLIAAPPAAPASLVGNSPQQRPAEEPAAELPSLVGPASAALQCSLCSAKAGLWTFFPQCKPLVLAAPRRRGTLSVQSPTNVAVGRASVSRHVAADLDTTIAGGSMTAAAATAAPRAADQSSAGAAPPGATSQEQADVGADSPAGAAEAGSGAQPAPFGSGIRDASTPVFGFAALHASAPAPEPQRQAASVADASSIKRKQPDFSWEAVIADINAKATAEKRSKSVAAASSNANGTPASHAAAPARAPAAGARPGSQLQVAAAAAVTAKFRGAAVSALDPLALHRSFCPWVNCTQASEKEGRCGWKWCLQQLAAPSTAAAPPHDVASEAADEAEGDGGRKGWDPATLLRNVLKQVDVHK